MGSRTTAIACGIEVRDLNVEKAIVNLGSIKYPECNEGGCGYIGASIIAICMEEFGFLLWAATSGSPTIFDSFSTTPQYLSSRLSIYTYPRPLSPLTIHSDSSPSEWRTARPFGSHSSQVSMKVHPENSDRCSPSILSSFRDRLFRSSCTNRGSNASTYFQNVSASSQGSEFHSPRPPRYGRSHVLKPVDRHRNVRICRVPRCILVEGDSLKLARGGILPVRQKGAFRGRPCRGDRRAWSNAVPV